MMPPTGVQVITGLNLLEAVGIGAYYGAGMEVTNGAGASIFTGASFYDYNGIYTQVGRRVDQRGLTLISSEEASTPLTLLLLLLLVVG